MDAVEWSEILKWVPRKAEPARDPEFQRPERCGGPLPAKAADGGEGVFPADTA